MTLAATGAADDRGVRRIFLDTEPLRRDRDYRWLWSGQVVNGIGNQITRIALPYQVYVLTGSTLAIAALTLFQLVPILLFALGAGSLADAVDRRRLLMATQAGLAACSLALVLLALTGSPPLVALFAVAFVAARAVGASTSRPARRRSRASCRPSGCPRPSRSTSSTSSWPRSSARRIGGHPHRDGRAGRRLRGRPRLVHRVVRGAARDPAAPAARGRHAARASRRSARACASPGAGGRSSARSSSTSTR